MTTASTTPTAESRSRTSREGTRDDRRAAGKALRHKASPEAYGKWRPPSRRADPVGRLVESSEGRLAGLIPIRYGRMMQTPFTFYRGAAAIMAADLSSTPVSGLRVQACGDCHLLNFGAFATPERRVIFDINDFDETLPAPWEWDLKRLVASFVVAGRNNGFDDDDARACAHACARSYREHLAALGELAPLDRWYERVDVETMVEMVGRKNVKKRMHKRLRKAASQSIADDLFPRLATADGGTQAIKDHPPLIFHYPPTDEARASSGRFLEAFQDYRSTLSDDRKVLLDRYEIKDVAMKVVGVGSVGTRCGILLLMTRDCEPLFLQVKEARRSVLEPYAGKSRYPNRGQRVVEGQRLMQSASDMFLGWTTGLKGRHFYCRQLRDMKIKPLVEILDEELMQEYAVFCGWALARAHAKSGDPCAISGYLGSSERFDEAAADFAVAYANQNEKDHEAFLKAIRAGKLEVTREV